MWFTYYNEGRFKFIHDELIKRAGIIKSGRYVIYKAMAIRSTPMNVYIDSSDGFNEDLDNQEYIGRLMQILGDCPGGKPFLIFKEAFSLVKCSKMIEYARANNGDVEPFFIMNHYDDFYEQLLPIRKQLIEEQKNTEKKYDVGFFADLKPSYVEKPDATNPLLSWNSCQHFGFGVDQNTGYYELTTRQHFFKKFKQSRFSFNWNCKIPYLDYLRESFKWKVCFSPPGCGEYSARILDHAALGQVVVMRKTSYDNAISWKGYFPQIDFEAANWEDELQKVIDNYKYWEEKSLEYFDTVYTPKNIVDYMFNRIDNFMNVKNIKRA